MMRNADSGQAGQLYVAISLALALPVALWPLAWLGGGWPETGAGVQQRWLTATVCLLMAAVVADTIFSGMRSSRQILVGTIWMILASQVSGLAFRTPSGMFLLAGLFGLHALRSAIPLWRNDEGWWLWPAWARDTLTAVVLFGWLGFLRHG